VTKRTKSLVGSDVVPFPQQPALQLIYDTAPIGLACLSPDCRYLQINQRLTETAFRLRIILAASSKTASQRLRIQSNRSCGRSWKPVNRSSAFEVAGQRADQAQERSWIT
jgi:hypothetical protein